MNILICIGANARIIQQCLKSEKTLFNFIYLFSRNNYYGILPTSSIHIKLEDPLLILLKIKEISEKAKESDNIKIIYSSFCTNRNLNPEGCGIWDAGFSLSLQCLVLNTKNLTRLAILGSTQAVWFPFSKDFYLRNKILELNGFLQLTSLDVQGKLCYLALPPLDESRNLIGKLFIKTRKECAAVIVRCLDQKNKLLIPRGVYAFIAKIFFRKYLDISNY